MDVRYINPFIDAFRITFERMVHTPISIGRPSLRNSGRQISDRDTIAILIRLSGGHEGIVVFRFPTQVALELIAGFADQRPREVDDAGVDALGEIANIVVGNAKKNMPGGLTCISPPAVVRDGRVAFSAGEPILCVPVRTSVGFFSLEAQLRPGAPLSDFQFDSVSLQNEQVEEILSSLRR